MKVYVHPDHVLHNPTEPHRFGGQLLPPAETARRAERILESLAGRAGFDVREPSPMDLDDLLLVHEPRYLEFLRTAHQRWRASTGGPADGEAVPYIRPLPGTSPRRPTHIDAELAIYSNDVDPILEGTWRAAISAAASALAAVGAVVDGDRCAYAISRPPGHHAAQAVYGGYCFLNNTALAAAKLSALGGKVAVIDLDGHHGNGTQTVFWKRGDVLTTSIHGNTDVHFPFFLGYPDEIGEGAGKGTNLNIPLDTGSAWPAYSEALDQACAAVDRYRPDWLVIALGVDSHVKDRVLGLDDPDYPRIGVRLEQLALPTVFIQEGGYGPGVLEHAVPAVLDSFQAATRHVP